MSKRDLNYYLSLPYTIEVLREEDDEDGDETWFASVRELPGCMTEADSFAELGEMIRDAMAVWIEDALEDGDPVPEPRPLDDYSGKFVVRVPRSLHRDLTQSAEREGVSLNSFANMALTQGVSGPGPAAATTSPEPAPLWPRLSDVAFRAMVGAGLEVEAKDVNEKFFADWLEKQLAQARAALQQGDLDSARSYLDECRYALRLPARASRLMDVFRQSVEMLDAAIEREWQWTRGEVQARYLRQRLSLEVREVSARSIDRQREERQQRERSGYDHARRRRSDG
ncbi:MAG: toxin-antitoxin system HicB family antitoxin [Chloroflexota bacterium]